VAAVLRTTGHGRDDNVLTYSLSDLLITLAVLAPFVAFFIALVMLRGRQVRRRHARFTEFASKHGLDYTPEDPFGLVDERFRIFRRGEERRCTNVVSGEWKGLRIRYADYEYWLRGKRAQTSYRSIVLFELPIDAPQTSIRRENVLTRTADAAGVEDIDFESEEFNRTYRVSSEDPEFARALIDARMMAWLLDEAKHSGFELRGSVVVLHYVLFTDPNDLDWFLDRAIGFRDHIPRVVGSERASRSTP
jgi:hypothetical protein